MKRKQSLLNSLPDNSFLNSAQRRKLTPDYSLYLVTDRTLSLGRPLSYVVEEAILGGVTIVQIREKDCSITEFVALAKELKKITQKYNIPLLINDRVDVALAIGADGVHLGQSDFPYSEARLLLGADAIIGLSVENFAQVETANHLAPDYLGVSPIFSTPTKTDTIIEWGLDGLNKIKDMTKLPLVAIGGINKFNTSDIIEAGADGIAVVSAICSAANPRQSASELKEIVKTKVSIK